MSIDLPSVIEKILAADYAYYILGRPIMSDLEYDGLKELVRSIEPDHPILAKVGHQPADPWQPATHNIRMGSLSKVNSEEEARKWAGKYPSQFFLLQHKEDGSSVSLDYDFDVFVRGVTRGGGDEGEDISVNVRKMKNFLPECKPGHVFTGSIRAEILLSRADFDRINSILPDDEKYENPRNAAAGICRRRDGKFCQYLYLIAYDITENVDEDEKAALLARLGFATPWGVVGSIDEIVAAYNKVKEDRKSLEFDIDGTVIKVCSRKIQETAGIASGRPRAQVAWKFDPPGAATVFDHEIWDVGRTGVVTPLALVEPIKIEGSTIRRATLHNIAEIKRLGIGRGDLVMLIKANDIIPKIVSVIEHKGNPIVIPTHCPSCKSELENDGTRLKCHNDDCPGRNIYRILNWIKVTKIDEFGEALAFALRDEGKLARIISLYQLKQDDIAGLEGWGASSAGKILNNIEASKLLRPEVFLAAVGIPGISIATAEELLKAFGSIEALFTKSEEDITKLHGFAETSARSVVSGLKKYQIEIEDLLKVISFH